MMGRLSSCHQAGCMVSTAGRVQGSGAQGFATVVVDLRVQAHFGSDLGYSFVDWGTPT